MTALPAMQNPIGSAKKRKWEELHAQVGIRFRQCARRARPLRGARRRAAAAIRGQDRRVERHVVALSGHDRPGLAARRPDGRRRLHEGEPEERAQGDGHLGRPSEQARYRLQHRAAMVPGRECRRDHRRAEFGRRARRRRHHQAVQQGEPQRLRRHDASHRRCLQRQPHPLEFDNFALANGTGRAVVATGGDTWFFITADYAFGHDLEAQTSAVVKQQGGNVIAAVRAPRSSPDFSSFLVQAQSSGAKVIWLANAGGDTVNAIKQAAEFGITPKQKLAGLLVFLTDIHSLGLPVAQNLLFTESFYWDLNDKTRAWSERFGKRHKTYPTSNHASAYSAALHYLKAMEVVKSRDGKKGVEQMKAMTIDAAVLGTGTIREAGRKMPPMYLFQAKAPAESKSEWDLYKMVKEIPVDQAWRPLSEGGCSLVAKKG